MLFDSRKSGKPGLRNAFRVTTQKILYGIVIGAAGTRGIYFTIQVCVRTCVYICLYVRICMYICTWLCVHADFIIEFILGVHSVSMG